MLPTLNAPPPDILTYERYGLAGLRHLLRDGEHEDGEGQDNCHPCTHPTVSLNPNPTGVKSLEVGLILLTLFWII